MIEMNNNFCKCGCGQNSGVYSNTDYRKNQIKGQFRKFIHGHNRKGAEFKPREIGDLCACGCGQKIIQKYKYYIPRFICGHNNAHKDSYLKGKTLEEVFGVEKARLIKEKLSVSYEEKYGIDKAREIKEKSRISHTGLISPKKGREIILREIRFCICGCNKSKRVKVTSKWKTFPGHYMKIKSLTFWEIRYCECGCGETFNCRIKDSQRFMKGHQGKVRRKRVYKICKFCNNKYWIQNNEEKKGIKQDYCSRKCGKKAGIWIKKGENNSSWQGGKSFELYGLEFNEELKQKIKERDNFKCQECDVPEMENVLTVHHIDYNKKNNDSKNLITLCRGCNARANGNRRKWTEWFKFKMLEKVGIIDSEENAQISPDLLDSISDDRRQ